MTKISDIQVRTLKAYKHHQTKYYRNDYIAPYIRLCGKWLEDAGIKCGDNVTINKRHFVFTKKQLTCLAN